MACEGYGLLLSRYVDGEGTPEERVSVERHVALCAPCRAEMKEFERHESLVAAALGSGPFGDRLVSRVQTALGSGPSRRRPDLRTAAGWRLVWSRVRPVLGAPQNLAAAALLLASAGLYADSRGIAAQNRELQQKVTNLEQGMAALQRQQSAPIVRATEPGAAPRVTPPEHGPAPAPSVAAAGSPPRATSPDAASSEPASIDHDPGVAAGVPALMINVLPQPEGNHVYWSVEHAPAGTLYGLYRRAESETDFSGPLNSGTLDGFEFVDEKIDPMRTYWYKVKATVEDVPVVETPPVVVLSQGNLEIVYNGTMGEAGVTKDQASFKVRRLVDGQWVEFSFRVAPGQKIGRSAMCHVLGREFDFGSGFKLREIGPAPHEKTYLKEVFTPDPATGRRTRQLIPETWTETSTRVVLEGPSGETVELFKGESHVGVAP